MPQIGWLEILIIASVAILVVGPKDFPIMLKKIGGWIGSVKRYVGSIQSEVSNITDIENEKTNETLNKEEIKDNNKKDD
tara:strand:+ start:346 stop:582 length:237 start_codon:yes stop_codon:yes gene_type:complete